MNTKFYICRHCGNLVQMVHDAGVPMMCCGQKMTELIPGTSDGAHESMYRSLRLKETRFM